MKLFLKYATQPATLKRSVKVASLVGTILAAINHYDMFLSGVYSSRRLIQILVTYCVPFSVSTASSALQGRAMELYPKAQPGRVGPIDPSPAATTTGTCSTPASQRP